MASDVTKSLSWIKTVREKVEKTDATTPAPTTTSTQTSTPGQTDPTDEGTTVETDENTSVEGGKTHKTCHNKISGTMEVTTVTTSLRNGSEKSSPVFAVWMLFAAYLIIVHFIV